MPPPFIDGVLVHRSPHHPVPKFHIHAHPIPLSALSPGRASPPIPFLPSPPLRILYIHPPPLDPTETTTTPPLDFPSIFFGYWSTNIRQSHTTTSMAFFRADLRPLHPRQAEVLWAFCEQLVREMYPAVQNEYPWAIGGKGGVAGGWDWDWGRGFERVVEYMREAWRIQCTEDNFSAFFEGYRRRKLKAGREGWRGVEALSEDVVVML